MIGLSSHLALQTLVGGVSGVSDEARAVRKAVTEIEQSTERSIALFGEKAAALSQLAALAAECAETGWDGGEAVGLNSVARRTAERFIRALPEDMPLPEFAPEPDGSISIDWIDSRNRLFSLSVGVSDRLAYAWLDGTDKGHGVARFDGRNIPPRVLDGIKSIVRRHADLWAA